MADVEQLPGVDTGSAPDRIILHVDMDCFYASCERRREPTLRGEPVVVGMGYEEESPSGAVATASYEARNHGVESAMAISSALDRLPRKADTDEEPAGYYRPVDMEYYSAVSDDIQAILREYADRLRLVSIDEAYLDVTDRTEWSVAEGFARHIKERIATDIGVPASVGVAPNMSTAKIASDYDKPDGLVVVPPADVREFLAPIPIEDLHGIGPVTASDLHDRDIQTAADIAAMDPDELEASFGERGIELYERARGIDDRPVKPTGLPKSLSRESAFQEAINDVEAQHDRLQTLAVAVADRARRKEALYRTIGIKVVTPPFDINTREQTLPGPVDDPSLLEDVALDLFEEFAGQATRKLGVRVSNLSFTSNDQEALDSWSEESEEATAIEDASDWRSTDGTTPQSRTRLGQTRLSDFTH